MEGELGKLFWASLRAEGSKFFHSAYFYLVVMLCIVLHWTVCI